MADREAKLSRLVPGDIFHAECPSGASLICLVEAIANGKIEARRVTTQDHVSFELSTGLSLPDDGEARCAIDSIAPLPVDTHNVMLGLDRKMRLRFEKPNRAEKDALLFVADFYPANPL
ncbi:MAG TPA: hypothetical protein VF915_01125 [Reyranella sp.]